MPGYGVTKHTHNMVYAAPAPVLLGTMMESKTQFIRAKSVPMGALCFRHILVKDCFIERKRANLTISYRRRIVGPALT